MEAENILCARTLGFPVWRTVCIIHFCYPTRPLNRLTELDVEKRAPITVKYEIPYFTVSGIQVRYLKIVEKSGYQALPWVRYITQNGDDYRCIDKTRSYPCMFCWRESRPLQFEDGIGEGQRPYCTDVVMYIFKYFMNIGVTDVSVPLYLTLNLNTLCKGMIIETF